jgi:hypothetical protein
LQHSHEHKQPGGAGTEASRQDRYQAGSLSLFGAVVVAFGAYSYVKMSNA